MDVATVETAQDIALRLAAVQQRIAVAASASGRTAASVTLVAVCKTIPAALIRPVFDAGVRHFGENRVQEAADKAPHLPPTAVWHMIGHLQRNKLNHALDLFSLIHSVDSVALADAIGRRAQERGEPARVLLQVNVAHKESQFGFSEQALAAGAVHLAAVPGLQLDGLMCIAPEVENPEMARPYFRRLADVYHGLAADMRATGHPWSQLSMGMTNDYAVAIEEGATLVRIGRAIFGDRSTPAVAARRG